VTQHSRDTPQFYLTAPSPCPYLPGRHERKVFTHLVGDKAGDLNDLLTHGGFRRSQSIAYRPACDQCRACVSVRVIANEFRPSRNFRKILARNADIVGEQMAPAVTGPPPDRRIDIDRHQLAIDYVDESPAPGHDQVLVPVVNLYIAPERIPVADVS